MYVLFKKKKRKKLDFITNLSILLFSWIWHEVLRIWVEVGDPICWEFFFPLLELWKNDLTTQYFVLSGTPHPFSHYFVLWTDFQKIVFWLSRALTWDMICCVQSFLEFTIVNILICTGIIYQSNFLKFFFFFF